MDIDVVQPLYAVKRVVKRCVVLNNTSRCNDRVYAPESVECLGVRSLDRELGGYVALNTNDFDIFFLQIAVNLTSSLQ